MPETPEIRSALAEVYRAGRFGAVCPEGAGVTLSERQGVTLVHLAGRPDSAALVEAAAAALGVGLPLDPNTTRARDDLTILWLAPTRWLVQSATLAPGVLARRLREATVAAGGAVNDVSGGRVVVRLTGPAMREVLAKGCPIDLHPQAFPPGACAQTALGSVAVLVHAVATGAFDLYLPRSFALHAWEWLLHAAEACGGEIVDRSG